MTSVAFAALVVSMATMATVWPSVESYRVEKYSLLMPNIRPKKTELYLCTAIKIDPIDSYFIVGFEPRADDNTSHHMLVYGCSDPGSDELVWNCGQMQMDSNTNAGPCKSKSNIFYAWGRNAPALNLPDGVGFKVGGDSKMNYLVLQVHYNKIFKDDETDNSGVYLSYTKQQLEKQAGVYLLATDGTIPPHSVEYMETSCPLLETGKVIHPFAYRVHTHELGKVVAGYRVRTTYNGSQQWDLLGKRDPMTPQMFYPIENNLTVKSGDILAARCTMESRRSNATIIGPTSADEMCNFYVMYWVEKTSGLLGQKVCGTVGAPGYYWHSDRFLTNIPFVEASTL